MGVSEGGPIEMMFAATHPDRVEALVLANSYARLSQAPDSHRAARRDAGSLRRGTWPQTAAGTRFRESTAVDPRAT